MPAIHLARLKLQISQLVEKYDAPKEFVVALKDFFDFYADRTIKPGRGGSHSSLILSYNVPKQVTRQIETALHPKVTAEPDNALALADLIWQEKWLECRVLALRFLGWVPINPPERIIDRLLIWARERVEDRVLDASFAKGMVGLQQGAPDLFFGLLESWLIDSNPASRKLGLRVIPPLVSDSSCKNLPRIFHFLTPFVQQVSLAPNPDVLAAIQALAQQSPQETAFFLRSNLTLSQNPGVYALIRQCLDAFSSPVKDDLRAFLHQRREEYGEQ
jgi:hypothetical protein